MLGESRDENERDLILRESYKLHVHAHTERQRSKEEWREKILSKIKDES